VTSQDRDHATAVASDEPERSGSRSSRTSKRKQLPLWQETILLLGIALLLAALIKALFVQAFYIPSESMEPGLVRNDRILVEKMSYWFGGTPQRGDVVVFKDPGGWLNTGDTVGPGNPVAEAMAKIGLYPQGGHLVKRVIGVEGDVIKCCDKRGRISVNGTPLNENLYVKQEAGVDCRGPMPGGCDWKAGPVPDGQLFVMGDNRNHSADSSAHMCTPQQTECSQNPYVPTDLVVGKVFVLVWPADHFRWVQRPDTFDDVRAAP
jgi:signal peptidase I